VTFLVGQQRQRPEALVGVGDDPFQQGLEMPQQAVDGGRVEQVVLYSTVVCNPSSMAVTNTVRSNLAVPLSTWSGVRLGLGGRGLYGRHSRERTSPGTGATG